MWIDEIVHVAIPGSCVALCTTRVPAGARSGSQPTIEKL